MRRRVFTHFSFIATLIKIFQVQALGLVCGFAAHILLARMLGAAEYGVFNFIFSLATILCLVGSFGFQGAAPRLIPEFLIRHDSARLRGFFKFSQLFVFVLSFILGGLAFWALANMDLKGSYSPQALIPGILLVPFLATLRVNSGILKGFKKGAWAIFYESTGREIFLVLILAGFFMAGASLHSGAQGLQILTGLYAALFIGAFGHARFLVQKAAGRVKAQTDIQTWLSLSWPMMLVISVQILIHRADIIILGFMAESDIVGAYSAASKLAMASTLSFMTINTYFSPRAAEYFTAGQASRLKALYIKTTAAQTFITAVLAGMIALVGPFILGFFGTGFLPALPALYILLGGLTLSALWGPAPLMLLMTGFEKQAMWLTFGITALNIGLNIILIPFYGMAGAAVASVLALNLRGLIALVLSCKGRIFSPPP